MTRETRLDKIKKCLALAKGTTNEAEAISAMEMAQRMALREGLDLNQINIEETKKTNVIFWEVPQKTKSTPAWRALLISVIADNFRCRIVKFTAGGGSRLQVYGCESDIEVFRVMLDYAETVMNHMFNNYLKGCKDRYGKLDRRTSLYIKKSYVSGFIAGMSKALEDNVKSYNLMVVVPEEVENAVKDVTKRTHKVKNVEDVNLSIYLDGREDFMHDVYSTLDILPTNEEANRIMDSFDRVTSGIRQEHIIDKISTEIEQIEINGHIRDVECFSKGLKAALNIIKKYRKEGKE